MSSCPVCSTKVTLWTIFKSLNRTESVATGIKCDNCKTEISMPLTQYRIFIAILGIMLGLSGSGDADKYDFSSPVFWFSVAAVIGALFLYLVLLVFYFEPICIPEGIMINKDGTSDQEVDNMKKCDSFRKGRRHLIKFTGMFLMLIAFVSLITESPVGTLEERHFQYYAMSAIILAMGTVFFAIANTGYKGGPLSMIGTVLFGIGLMFVFQFPEKGLPEGMELYVSIFWVVILNGVGGLMIYYGHRVHLARNSGEWEG